MTKSDRVSLPRESLNLYPTLSQLTNLGLPRIVEWSRHSNGPKLMFEFQLLDEGGQHYDVKALPAGIASHYYLLQNMLIIGTYSYMLSDITLTTDVCVDVQDGKLWIVDLKQSTILMDKQGSAMRVPIFLEYLNGGCDLFQMCITAYIELLNRFHTPSRDRKLVHDAWRQLEGYIRKCDPEAFERDQSFWPSAIGEMLEPFR